MAMQNIACLFQCRTDLSRYQIVRRHEICYRLITRIDKTRVAIGQDADQFAAVFSYGHAGNPVVAHDVFSIAQRCCRRQRD